ALDVRGVHGPVGLAGVDPEADPLGQLLPDVHIALDRLAAAGGESLHPVVLDAPLVLEAQLLLDLELDRQAVAVPAALAVDPVAAHGPEPGEQVLEGPGLDVVDARAGGGRGWALVEHVRLGSDPLVDRALEHLAVAPQLQDAGIQRGEVEVGVDLRELAHLDSFPGNCLLTLEGGSGAAAGPLNCPRSRLLSVWPHSAS